MIPSHQSIRWDNAKVKIAIRYGLKRFLVDFSGSFARLGSHPRCEIQVPFGKKSVLAYLQVANGGLAVVALSPEGSHRCRTQFIGAGDSLSLASPITISVESIELNETKNELFGHSQLASPDALLFEKCLVKGGLEDAAFLVANGISILGSSRSCNLRLKHRSVAPYQCAVIRTNGRFPSMRIVDLLSNHSTTIGNQIARGQEIEVNATLSIEKLVFVPKRLREESVQILPSPERDLKCPNQCDQKESRPNEFQQVLEITNDIPVSEIGSSQPCNSRSERDHQLLLLEMSRSMASLVERIEKIESTLSFLNPQLGEFALNNRNDCSEKTKHDHQIAMKSLPSIRDDSSRNLETVYPKSDSFDALSYVESPAEAYVLGQLIDLRTRDDSRYKSKLILATVTCLVLSVFVLATLWYRVPSGWKERIWEYCTFTNS